jgi:hypothetical protein
MYVQLMLLLAFQIAYQTVVTVLLLEQKLVMMQIPLLAMVASTVKKKLVGIVVPLLFHHFALLYVVMEGLSELKLVMITIK